MFATLIRIEGIIHTHIGTIYFVYDRLWKDGKILGLIAIRYFPFNTAEFQKIVP